MGDFAKLRNKLFDGLSTLMSSESPQADALRAICSAISSKGLRAVLFGGALRDLVVFGNKQGPRDFDIVVDVNAEELFDLFHAKVLRRTRFGGLHILHEGWPLDIWPLERTWAFQHMAIAPSFENLPKTTFLNVEAVAVDLSNPGYWEKALYEDGFFSAIAHRAVEINLRENPYPSLCVVRSLITAWKLSFAIDDKLANYIRRYGASLTLAEIDRIQNEHYGHPQLPSNLIRSWVDDVLKNSTGPAILLRR
jgi:hypothetical protein